MPQTHFSRRPLFPHTAIRAGFAFTLAVVTLLPACKKSDESSSKAVPAAKDEHGHDHGEAAHSDEVTLTADAIDKHGIHVAPAQLWVLRPTVVASARIAFNAEAMAHVGSPLRGRAVEIKARLGDAVKRDDPLVIVESPELGEAQADFLQRRTAAQNAAAQVDLSKAAWDRAKALLDQSQGISLTEVQKREAEYKTTLANVKVADAAANASENGLLLLGMNQEGIAQLATSARIVPRYTIRAAMDGQIIQREITLGELVSPDRDAVMVIADTKTLWVLADVPEANMAQITIGAKAWIAVGDQKFEGAVAFASPFVDSTTRTAQVRIEIPGSALAARPGMFAQAEIVLTATGGRDPAPTVAVPDEAIQTVEGGPAVFVPVANEPNTFAKRAITVGKAIGGLVPISAGLVEGESFVTTGTFILKAELGKSSAAHEH